MAKNKLQKGSSCSRISVDDSPLTSIQFRWNATFSVRPTGLPFKMDTPAGPTPGMALSPSPWCDRGFCSLGESSWTRMWKCRSQRCRSAIRPTSALWPLSHTPMREMRNPEKVTSVKAAPFPERKTIKNSVSSLVESSILMKNLGGQLWSQVSELESVSLGHSRNGLWDRSFGTGTVKRPQLIFQGHDKNLSEHLGPRISCPDWSLLVCSLRPWGGLRGCPRLV